MIQIDGNSLTIQEIQKTAVDREKVSISPEIIHNIQQSRQWVEQDHLQGRSGLRD